jgi:hypothetical protein
MPRDRALDRCRYILGRRAKRDLKKLLQGKAHSPGRQDRVERPPVKMLNDRPLKEVAGGSADHGSQRQRQPEATKNRAQKIQIETIRPAWTQTFSV